MKQGVSRIKGPRTPQSKGLKEFPDFKFRLMLNSDEYIRKENFVIDLGSSPGIFSKTLSTLLAFPKADDTDNSAVRKKQPGQEQRSPSQGLLCSIDIAPMEKAYGTHFIQGDFRSVAVQQKVEEIRNAAGFRQVRPNTSGSGRQCIFPDILKTAC